MNISFIIPAFNYAHFISYAVGSIMDGNFEAGDEFVICNDASTDHTAEVLTQLQQRWPVIQVVHHEENRGGGAARNTAVRHSSNPLIFCLDADNILTPNSIPPLKQFLLDNEADVAAWRYMYYFGSCPEMIRWEPDVVTLEHYLNGASIPGHCGNYMFTKAAWEKVGGYPEDTWLDAWGFGFRQAATGSKIVIMPDGLYYHRRGHDSYYIRGSKERSPSQAALPVIRPFFHLLDEQDVDYVLSSNDWKDRLAERPLRRSDEDMCAAVVLRPTIAECQPAA